MNWSCEALTRVAGAEGVGKVRVTAAQPERVGGGGP